MPYDQQATFEYLHWRDEYKIEKPYEMLINLPEELQHTPRTNLQFKPAQIGVKDARGREADFSLNTQGFCWRRHSTKATNFQDRDAIVNQYLPEMAALINDELEEVSKIFIFDWRVCSITAKLIRMPTPL